MSGAARWLADPLLQVVLHGAFAALFARAALHKARDPRAFRRALAGYGLLPEGLVAPAAWGLAAAEAAVAVALCVPGLGAGPALAGVALLALYALAMAAALAAGRRDADCGCGPPDRARPIGPDLVARNLGLAALLAAAAPTASARPLGALDLATAAAAWLAAALLHAGLERALAESARPLAPRRAA